MTFVDLSRCCVQARSLLVRSLVVLVALIAVSEDSLAGQLKLAWDAVAGATGYQLYYGTSTGNYSSNVDAQNQTSATLTGLTDGARYYLAVKAYNGTTTSNFSSEVNAVVPAAAPVASFNASPTTGTAPLVVTLTDTSSGSIASRSWNLGDGTTATTQLVAKTYSNPGTYGVTLTVAGSGGSTTATRSISVTAPTVTGGTGGTTTGGGTTGGTTGSTTGGTTLAAPQVARPAAPRVAPRVAQLAAPPAALQVLQAAPRGAPPVQVRTVWSRPTALRSEGVAGLLTHREWVTPERFLAPRESRRPSSDEH